MISFIKRKSVLQILSTLEVLDEDFAEVDAGLLPLDGIKF
ncbi:SpoVT/AbrB like domain protein (plasmid) ['Nostoc azollae' 0708]|jgi:antitoxin VapB|uniref:SpoVT/AbrB like domain protein n=1 Tax=Nostoc azollae (strain 0708) TaxID=551115 RepID=D7E5K5_NOSA0|nr:SpoVT/AbrB like domain protein ['Nostoc azollae' 0708]